MTAHIPYFGRVIVLALLSYLVLSSCGQKDNSSASPAQETANSLPAARPVGMVVKAGETLTISFEGNDADNDNLEFEIVNYPVSGQLTLTDSTAVYTPVAGFSGLVDFTYRVSDGKSFSDPALVRILFLSTAAQSTFWLKSEAIAGTVNGEPISGWTDAISGTLASFADSQRTPRLAESWQNNRRAVDFQFLLGANATNDFISYNSLYIYSPSGGLTFFAVGESTGPSSSIAPVLAFGDWLTEGYGFSWNPQVAGVGTPTSFGGRDDKGILAVSKPGPAILTAYVRFSDPGQINGIQQARFNGGAWAYSTEPLSLAKLTAAEIDERATAHQSGGPIMVGGNNDAANNQPDRRFNGKLSEILLINRNLSDSEIETVELYLKTKFGLN